MMHGSIFCPSSHLILSAKRCPQCGWERPPAAGLGQFVWGPLDLVAGLGGPGRAVYAGPAFAGGLVVFPLRNGELVALDLRGGGERWRVLPEPGFVTRCLESVSLAGNVEQVLIAPWSDERSLELAGFGQLETVDPLSGQRQKLWQPQASLISPVTPTAAFILVRTSASELVALTCEPKPSIAWAQPLDAWWALQPVVISHPELGGIVFAPDGRPMQAQSELKAFRLSDGKPLWQQVTEGMLAFPPVLVNGVLIYRDGRKILVGRNPLDGHELWRQPLEHVYSNLAAGGEHFYLAARGAGQRGEPDYYTLQAWEPHGPQLIWQVSLPERVRLLHLAQDGTLLAGGDDGGLLAFLPGRNSPLWQQRLGSQEDPIQTELLIADGLLLAGTYAGKVAAIQLQSPAEAPGQPEEHLARGEWEQAAAAYALRGDYAQAAALYAERPAETVKAIALYQAGELFTQAGQLARLARQNDLAVQFFEKAGDYHALADTLREMGNESGAAAAYEQAGDLESAASLYQQAGEFAKARQIFKQLNDWRGLLNTFTKMPFDMLDIEWLEKQERFTEAAQAAQQAGLLEKAARLYERAGDLQAECTVLLMLCDVHPEEWSLLRLASLSRKLGWFRTEGETWAILDRPKEAGDAYQRAALQAIQVDPEREAQIAELFEKAADYFAEVGLEAQEKSCRSQVIHYRSLPLVLVEGKTIKAFREEEFNTLELVIRNMGRGVAHNICVQVGGERFEVDLQTCMVEVKRLAPHTEKTEMIYLRPRKEQIGDAVPLLLEWSWQDRFQKRYSEHISTPVQVRRLSDTSPTGAPVVIHAQTYVQGTLIGGDQIEGDQIRGDQVQGDQIHGDQLQEGAQKGDRVEIRRNRVSPKPGNEKAISPLQCPNCHLPTQVDDQYCEGCGCDLTTKHGIRGKEN